MELNEDDVHALCGYSLATVRMAARDRCSMMSGVGEFRIRAALMIGYRRIDRSTNAAKAVSDLTWFV